MAAFLYNVSKNQHLAIEVAAHKPQLLRLCQKVVARLQRTLLLVVVQPAHRKPIVRPCMQLLSLSRPVCCPCCDLVDTWGGLASVTSVS